MHVLLKVNLLTDDETLPTDAREAIEKALGEIAANDPEGAEHARVAIEWKHTVMPRPYMAGLLKGALTQVRPTPPKKTPTARASARRSR